MALVFKDRVKVTSTTTGTGAFTLGSAVTGFQDFSVIGNGNTTYYTITDESGNWEVGIGTYTSSGTSLSRDTILESSSGGSAISFGAGTKTVFVTYPAEKSVYLDASDNLTNNITGKSAGISGTQTANTVYAAPNGSAGLASFRALVAADIPTLNQNTTGTASNVTGVVAIANGGSGQSTKTEAFDALSPTTTKGDLIVSNGTDNVRLAVGTNNYVLTADSTQASGVKWGAVPSYADIQTFSSSGTWTKPTGVTTVMVEVWGAGGGAGGGYRGTGANIPGGTGGGGGGFTRKMFSASDLTSTVTVTIATGGTGGASRTTNGAGNSGSDGGNTTFGSYISGYGGLGGNGGGTGTTGGVAGGFAMNYGGAGGIVSSVTTSPGGGSALGGAGGGCGSPQSTGTAYAPSDGGSQTAYTGGGGAAGTFGATSSVGTAGTGFQGGGGGGSTSSGLGRAGGAGGTASGGGGGGNGYNANSGGGGAGGNGYCIVYSW